MSQKINYNLVNKNLLALVKNDIEIVEPKCD